MNGQPTLERARELNEREEASLRRLTAQMQAEADELPQGGWVAERLDSQDGLWEWGERVLPELAALMAAETAHEPARSWVRRRSDQSPLREEEEACLRRMAALLRAEAAELGDGSRLATRLDGWGIRLALRCEAPERSPRIA
jgi:hypothetical protein